MICYNEHDKHLTKINLNKFALWICPLFKENSDLPWKLKKEKRKKKTWFVKKITSVFVSRVKSKILSRKIRSFFILKKNEILKRIKFDLCKV